VHPLQGRKTLLLDDHTITNKCRITKQATVLIVTTSQEVPYDVDFAGNDSLLTEVSLSYNRVMEHNTPLSDDHAITKKHRITKRAPVPIEMIS